MNTSWIRVDISWTDRVTGELRIASDQLIEVVTAATGEILVQDDNGCHRMVPLSNLNKMETT